MTMRVPEKRAGLSLPEYRRQSSYTAGSGLSARADDAFVEIRARAEEDEREAAGRFAATAGRAAQTAAQAWDDYQTSRATQAFNAFQTSMQERMYGEDGIFTRQGEAAFSIWGEAGQKTRPPVTAAYPRRNVRNDLTSWNRTPRWQNQYIHIRREDQVL